MRYRDSAPKPRWMGLLLVVVALQGCALFVSHYDAGAYQQFTSLKAFHLKFLEDNREAEGRSFDGEIAKGTCDAGELKFLEATEYAAGKNDETRVRAIKYLHNAFSNDCKLGKKKLFGTDYVQQQTEQLRKNYDLLIQGETSRVGAPTR